MPAIFDVKTLRVDKNLIIYNQGKGGKKAIRVVKKGTINQIITP